MERNRRVVKIVHLHHVLLYLYAVKFYHNNGENTSQTLNKTHITKQLPLFSP